MKVKPQLISESVQTFDTETGKRIIVIMKLWRFLNGKLWAEFPEGYKINWIAYNENNPNERVLFDNHHGKTLHYHIDQDKKGVFFDWISCEKVEELFWEKVQIKFGKLEKIW